METEKLLKSEEIKNKGNQEFLKKNYETAEKYYTEAIEILGLDQPKVTAYLCNRAMCYINQDKFAAAIEDAEKSIKADEKFIKGYYRKSQGLLGLGKMREAKKTLQHITNVLKINNKEVTGKIKVLSRLIKEKEFFESIQYEGELEKLNPEDIKVKNYDGPILEMDQEVNQEWLMNLLEYLKDQKKFHKKYVWILLKRVKEILDKKQNVPNISLENREQITVCGDIHGQYYDFLNIFKMNGYPSKDKPYLFNGDFVDRGSFSAECMIALYAILLVNPESIFLNRGNHENADLNKMYGFEGEILSKYDSDTFLLFVDSFKYLPLGHTIEKKVLVLHGGLFEKDGVKIEDLQKFERRISIPQKGLMCDMLWADPGVNSGRQKSQRGVSIEFGPDVSERFLNENNLSLLVRSHQMKEQGYEYQQGSSKVVTVFSAPKYCDQMTNKGAYIIFKKDLIPNFVTFEAVEHPPIMAMHYAKSYSSLFK